MSEEPRTDAIAVQATPEPIVASHQALFQMLLPTVDELTAGQK
jgi:hypothetical protein